MLPAHQMALITSGLWLNQEDIGPGDQFFWDCAPRSALPLVAGNDDDDDDDDDAYH